MYFKNKYLIFSLTIIMILFFSINGIFGAENATCDNLTNVEDSADSLNLNNDVNNLENNFTNLNINSEDDLSKTINENTAYENDLNNTKIETNLSGVNSQITTKVDYFNVSLKDINNNPLTGEKINITINNINYARTINENGYCGIKINLSPGEYTFYYSYLGSDKYLGTNGAMNVSVNKASTTLYGETLIMNYGEGNYFVSKLTDEVNKSLPNQEVIFIINGVKYYRTTNATGESKLKINLSPGNYSIECQFNGSNFYNTSTVEREVIVNRQNVTLISSNLTKYYGTPDGFIVKLLLNNQTPLFNEKITLTINGVTYYRTTNATGEAKLNINLKKKEHIK